jgi:hypothetical protein
MLPAAPLLFTARDLALCLMVYTYRGCTVDQLQARFFPTFGARTACYARLARLIEAGYLTRTRLPSRTGVGSGKTFLTLGLAARPLVAEALDLPVHQLERTPRSVSPLMIAHHLALGDVRLAIELAVAPPGDVTLTEWRTDQDLHRAPVTIPASPTEPPGVLIPDGAFTLELRDGSTQAFYVEMDLSTVPTSRWKTKLQGYLRLAQAATIPAPVLIVVPGPERQRAIVQWAQGAAAAYQGDATIFLVTTQAQISSATVLAQPIWQVAGGPSAWALRPSPPLPIPSNSGATRGEIWFRERGA